MPTLKEQLTKVLPDVLPKSPGEAINGTKLMGFVRGNLQGDYAENSIRQHFSVMAADSTSVIAKVDSGHGYYLREVSAGLEQEPTVGPNYTSSSFISQEDGGIGCQPEEKFRALYMRYLELQNRFAMRIDHSRAKRGLAGVNKWKFPDVIVLDWDVGDINDDGYHLDRNLLEIRRSLGEQPFRLTSVELKVELNRTSFRENFFQCVSNSKWAHHTVLGVAYKIDDATLVDELQRLGASYNVTIVSYSINPDELQKLPSVEDITGMSNTKFDDLAKNITLSTIATGSQRPGLDWEHIKDMRSQSDDFVKLFEWIAHCSKEGSPFKFKEFSDIMEIQMQYK